jgi:anti-sigma regulatory factor (Ser/Thr protein kinase)
MSVDRERCSFDPDGLVQRLEMTIAGDVKAIDPAVVRDPGEGFDPTKVPSPIIGDRIYAEHGRGIYLINQLMDEVRFNAGGTEIWMRKA